MDIKTEGIDGMDIQLQSRESVVQEVVVFDYPKDKYHLQL